MPAMAFLRKTSRGAKDNDRNNKNNNKNNTNTRLSGLDDGGQPAAAVGDDDQKKLKEAEAAAAEAERDADAVSGEENSNNNNSDGETLSPPAYDSLYAGGTAAPAAAAAAAAASLPVPPFLPTIQFQVETVGKPRFRTPGPPSAEPVMVYLVGDDVSHAVLPTDVGARSNASQPAFLSMRQSSLAESCALVAGGRPLGHGVGRSWGGDKESATGVLRTLSTTTYRAGPGRPPHVTIDWEKLTETQMDAGDDADQNGPAPFSTYAPDPACPPPPPSSRSPAASPFDITRKDFLSRTQRFTIPRLGTFAWRYAGRAERKAATAAVGLPGDAIHSLLVLDHVAPGVGSATTTATTATHRPVARLIRSDALRARGSTALSAGNGGRLQMDLRAWDPDLPEHDRKGSPKEEEEEEEAAASEARQRDRDRDRDRDTVVVAAVTTCLVMLKRETDRA